MIDLESSKIILLSLLSKLYNEREANSISRMYFEDTKGCLTQAQFDSDLISFTSKEPLQYITGIADFYGFEIHVDNSVLIPRPETEELVAWVIEDLKSENKSKKIIDIGTGSGCIPLVVAKHFDIHDIVALDVSKEALSIAKENFKKHGVNPSTVCTDFLNSDNWHQIGNVDLIISNPPYISFAERDKMKPNVLLYEPHIALFSGEDPLVFYRAIAQYAALYLKDSGSLYLELNEFFAEEIKSIYNECFTILELKADMQGKLRMLKCTGNKN